MRPYRITSYFRLMRLHQPVGIWLLLWPCWWAVALASGGHPSLRMLLLFALGAVLMRSAGCIVNDIADRKIDAQVERTKTRPLANGTLHVRHALLLLAGLLSASLLVAAALGKTVVMWAVLSLPLIAAYPLMKRVTWWPQFFLGLTFNWGALMGWAAVRGTVEWPAFALYAGGVLWTLGYDTIYAHQDKKDDASIGVKSTALKLGGRTKCAVAVFYVLAIDCWAMAATAAAHPLPACAGLAAAGAHFVWQLKRVDLDNPSSCRRVFISNGWVGLLIFLGFITRL